MIISPVRRNILFNLLSVNRNHMKFRKMCSLPTVFVRQFDNEETMKINFTYGSSEFPNETFTFMRSKSEQLQAALTRMKSKIQSSALHKPSMKKKKLVDLVDIEIPYVDIVLMKNGVKVDGSSKNIDAWTPETQVLINDKPYRVVINPPSISSFSLPKHIMSGFLVYPKITLEFCSREDSEFKWYREVLKQGTTNDMHNDEDIIKVKNRYWKFICQSYLYTTTESDLGCKLRLACIPKLGDKSGMLESVITEKAVVPGPEKCPFEDRQQYTRELTEIGSYRFVCYNILADLYADTDTARKELFPYCPVEFLNIEYRKQLYLKEITGYNADIICLQEVDRKVFPDDLVPVLTSVGFKGVFTEKSGVAEGLSCFYRDTKFKLIETHSIILSEAIKTEAVFKKMLSKIIENEKLTERFLSRTTALQVTLLESLDVPGKRMLIGNTHLYFHPNADNVRLLQATCCLLYLEYVLGEYQKKDPSYTIAPILCGDFNSCPEFGVYKLATEGFLPSNCIDWNSNPEEKVDGMDLSHSLQLCSACGIPEYTNYTQGFFGCLDYIFYDRSLFKVTQVVPFPTHEEVVKHTALPNKVFPSDHIALVSTLSWK